VGRAPPPRLRSVEASICSSVIAVVARAGAAYQSSVL
jgi:hypothetical protein